MDNYTQYEKAHKQSNKKFWNNDDDYEIPYNQRSYCWDTDNIKKYIQDIYGYHIGNSHGNGESDSESDSECEDNTPKK